MRVVVTDTSILINFAWIERLDLLRDMVGVEFWIPRTVVEEVRHPELRPRIEAAVRSGFLLVVEATLLEQEVFALLTKEDRLDPGEAECLAIAAARGCIIACDERSRKFLRVQKRLLGEGRCVTSLDLVVASLARGLLVLEQADGFLEVWRRHRFQPGIASFAERWRPDGGADRIAEGRGRSAFANSEAMRRYQAVLTRIVRYDRSTPSTTRPPRAVAHLR